MGKSRNRDRALLLPRGILAGAVFFAAWMPSQVKADEIRFRGHDGIQTGTVLEESGETVTIRFPREAIESVHRSPGSPPGEPKREPAVGLEERIQKLEKKLDALPVAGGATAGDEERGAVEGVIRWKNRPLAHGKVMIVPAKNTGLSPAPAESGKREGRYETETDTTGRYRFERVPAGEYRVYWMPDHQTGWVRRLREKADLDVVGGRVTVLNIPAEKK